MLDLEKWVVQHVKRNNVHLNPAPPSLEDKCLARVLEVAATTGGHAGARLGPSEVHQVGNAVRSKVSVNTV